MIKPTLAVTKWRNRKEVGRLCNPGQIPEDFLQRGHSKHFTINFLKESLGTYFFQAETLKIENIQFVETFLNLLKFR